MKKTLGFNEVLNPEEEKKKYIYKN